MGVATRRNMMELFLDALSPTVENPLWWAALRDAIPRAPAPDDCGSRLRHRLLLPRLVGRFGRVVALDFAPRHDRAANRAARGGQAGRDLSRPARCTTSTTTPVKFDVVVAINSIVMPRRPEDRPHPSAPSGPALKPGGQFPRRSPVDGRDPLPYDVPDGSGARPRAEIEEAERSAAFHGEHQYYEFAFGRFKFLGLRQKFWQPFEIRHRMTKAGFRSVELDRVLYPWDESMTGGADFADHPRSWDWFFVARP